VDFIFHATTSNIPNASRITSMRNPAHCLIQFIGGGMCGWALWSGSPHITGHVEPWDDGFFYYWASLFLTTLISAAISPATSWAFILGTLAGQVCYVTVNLNDYGPHIVPLWTALLIFGAAPSMAGFLIALCGHEFLTGYRSSARK